MKANLRNNSSMESELTLLCNRKIVKILALKLYILVIDLIFKCIYVKTLSHTHIEAHLMILE